ncbi:cache domain-containing protein [Salipaludibacillus sp. CF4.18]|uniref:cache domain-containing protein n=1 Tax=Salipaludibacillus sp. CF4.18 TaxID=3373081 RepID=UPI003EE70575
MFHTLRSKLLIFLILVAFIPMIIVGIISYNAQKQEITNSAERSLAIQSTSLSVEITRFLEERLKDIQTLANNPVLMDQDSEALDIREQMYKFLMIHNIYFDSLYITTDGTVAVETELGVLGEDLSERPWFEEALKGNIVISDIYYSSLIDTPALAMASPV